jgi:hypothetical protein
MSLMRCPHCGAENFTMEGWEDLDHCSSCGKPLGELKRGADSRARPTAADRDSKERRVRRLQRKEARPA